MKTIFVGYYSVSHEGCSEPIEAFDSEEKAEAWIAEQTKAAKLLGLDYLEYIYVELPIS